MRWNIDASHSTAEFSVRHLMITNVKGRFSKLTGSADFDPAHPDGGSFEATIDTASVDTRDEKRDAHLRSADFFDVEKFPTIAFKSKKVAKSDDGYSATGDLTIHGVTKEVTLEIEELSKAGKDPWGNTRVGASAHTKINRKDFGLGWNQALETGGVLVGEQVKISLEVSMVQAG